MLFETKTLTQIPLSLTANYKETDLEWNFGCWDFGQSTIFKGKGNYRKIDQVFLQWVELNTKNSTKRRLRRRLVEFLVFNSIY